MSAPDTLYCSFCGKSQHDVVCLIAGLGVNLFICNECVRLCETICREHEIKNAVFAEAGRLRDEMVELLKKHLPTDEKPRRWWQIGRSA